MLRICGFWIPTASEPAILYQPDRSLLTCRRRSCKCSAFADWINPLRGERKETLRVSDYIPLRAGGVGRDTISWPIKLRSANLGAPPEGPPWPYGIRQQLAPVSESDRISHCPRANYVCEAETCKKLRQKRSFLVCYADAPQTAIETRIKRMLNLKDGFTHFCTN